MNKTFERICLGIILAGGIWILLNFNYFWFNFRYYFHQTPVVSLKPIQQNSAQYGPLYPANILSIPSLGIQLPVIYVTDNSESAFQVGLQSGVVHYPGTALPGQKGNVYIFGHSSDFIFSKGSYKSAFATLPHIHTGADLYISDSTGKEYDYQVTSTDVTSPNDTSVLSQSGNTNYYLTLQTSYPVGTALERYIVRSTLVAGSSG